MDRVRRLGISGKGKFFCAFAEPCLQSHRIKAYKEYDCQQEQQRILAHIPFLSVLPHIYSPFHRIVQLVSRDLFTYIFEFIIHPSHRLVNNGSKQAAIDFQGCCGLQQPPIPSALAGTAVGFFENQIIQIFQYIMCGFQCLCSFLKKLLDSICHPIQKMCRIVLDNPKNSL